MVREYPILGAGALEVGATHARPAQPEFERVGVGSPAAAVMTDLLQITAVTVLAVDTVDEAHHRMIQQGVRLLLVVDQDRNIQGVITANDVLGEKPVQVAVQRGIPHSELLVSDIMTPRGALEVLDMHEVDNAVVGHVVATLKAVGRQHALVVDRNPDGRQRVRGIFSATQIARQLGAAIVTGEIARTFADIEARLAH